MADSFDFRECGELKVLPTERDEESMPPAEPVDAEIVFVLDVDAECDVDLADLEYAEGGGDLGRKNCLGCLRNLSPGPVLPRL